jgi:hypothetical protein
LNWNETGDRKFSRLYKIGCGVAGNPTPDAAAYKWKVSIIISHDITKIRWVELKAHYEWRN